MKLVLAIVQDDDALDLIEELTHYHKWYCGHFHTDKVVDKINFMFEGYKTLD